jgi:hypothetical protein
METFSVFKYYQKYIYFYVSVIISTIKNNDVMTLKYRERHSVSVRYINPWVMFGDHGQNLPLSDIIIGTHTFSAFGSITNLILCLI